MEGAAGRGGQAAAPTPRLRLLLAVMLVLGAVSAMVNLGPWRRATSPGAPAAASQEVPAAAGAAGAVHRSLAPSPLLEQYRRWLVAHPEDAAVRLALARELFVAGRFAEAEVELSILQAREPRRAELYYWRALVQKESGRPEAALGSIRQAQRLDPENPAFQEQLGEIYLALGRSEEAAETFDVCLKRNPESYAALIGKARAMEQMYEAKLPVTIPSIVEPVEKAVRLRPHSPQGVTMLARMSFAYLQQFDRAETLARQAMELDPHAAAPYLILVEVYLNRPEPESAAKAVEAAREAVKRDPNRAEPLYVLGRALLRQNDLQGAIAALERSTEILLMPQAVYQLSLAYARAGNTERAQQYSRLYDSWNRFAEQRKTLLALLQHRPSDVAIYAKLAELYLDAGAREPARNWARKGLKLRPDDARLRRILSRASALKG